MDKYSKNIADSLKVFYLLEGEIKNSLLVLSHNDHNISKMALRLLYIDICSFVDELDIFISHLYKEAGNYQYKNKFVLLTARPRALLNKNSDNITYFRNTLFAHNYRKKRKGPVVTPWEELLSKYNDAPVLDNEIRILGEISLLIIDVARNCFSSNDRHSYFDLVKSYEECKSRLSLVNSKNQQVPENYVELLKRDMYFIKDSLISHIDNYKIIAKKIGCSLIPVIYDEDNSQI